MDLDNIKCGLRAEIKKRENEQYATFQCNVRRMCKDVLDKLEEQESEIAELKATCVHTDNSAVIENMANELERLRPMETALELAETDNKGYLARIKELEAKIKELKEEASTTHRVCSRQIQQIASNEQELRHHKYKRCLAMARWCNTEADWYYGIGRSFRDRVEFYIKWYKRWLELAEKFKPNKEAK